MIDLHLHLDGSLRPLTVRELLRNNEITDDKLKVSDDCRDLNEYLEKFDYPISALQREENIIRAVYELGEDLHDEGVTYAEIRFAPMFSMKEGLSMEAVVEAAIEGAVQSETEHPGLKLGIILCCMRGMPEADNIRTVETARKYYGKVCAIDLAGAEGLYPTEVYKDIFARASRYDIPYTIHAGEAAGPESVWKALEFGASRIGHGVRSIEDDRLVEYLAEHEVPLEVCPISNMQTKVYADKTMYPVRQLFQGGVHVTLNTDNRTVSNTCLDKERKFLMNEYDFTEKDFEIMEKYSQKAAFLT